MPYIVTHDHVPLYYEDRGDGEAVVFIHGLGLSHASWFDQAVYFLPHYRVITYDWRGHGRSGTAASDWDIRDLTHDLTHLLNECGVEQVHLCAYAAGTLIALDFAALYPERVKRLVLTDGFHRVDHWYLWGKFATSYLTGVLGLHPFLAKRIAHAHGRNEQQTIHLRHEAMMAVQNEILRMIKACLRYHMDDSRLERLTHPILIIYGGCNRHMRSYRSRFLRHLPNVEVCLIPHVDHACPTQAMDAYNRIVKNFLS